MKKVILGIICLLVITTCGFEMPESITVKGNPGLYVPLGSAFATIKPEDRLDSLISPDNIKKMLNNKTFEAAGMYDDLKLYEVNAELAKEFEDDPTLKQLGIDSKVQTYVVRYPLAEMPLDIKKYTDKAMEAVNEERKFTLPSISAFPPNTPYIYLTEDGPFEEGKDGYGKPFVKIGLADMAKLVMWVSAKSDGVFGLEIDYDQQLAANLEIEIPGLGIEWMKGIPTDNNGNPSNSPTKLRYYNISKRMFYPRDQKNSSGTVINPSDLSTGGYLYLYARISSSFPQQKVCEPSLIFGWERAMIDTINGTDNQGSFKGEYPINNNLSKFLGDGVSFKTVKGFMYMSGYGVRTDDAKMSIGIYDASSPNTPLYDDNGFPLTYPDLLLKNVQPQPFPDGEEFTKNEKSILLNQSLETPLDMKDFLSVVDPAKLKVSITIQGMEINQTTLQDDASVSIQFDLLILIPLDLKVTKPAPAVTTDKGIVVQNQYVLLDLGKTLNKKPPAEGEKAGDLFGRKPGEDNALKYIKSVAIGIMFSKSDINILDPDTLMVLVTQEDSDFARLLEFKNNSRLWLTGPILEEIPFSPTFSVLLQKDNNANFGSFKILRLPSVPRFDFRLFVEARADLEYTLDF